MDKRQDPRPRKNASRPVEAVPARDQSAGTPVWARGGHVRMEPRNGPGERRADDAEAGKPVAARGRAATDRSPLAGGEGAPVDARVRGAAESVVGADLAEARVHQSQDDREFARLLGARAVTHGRDIFLGDGESETDGALMRHELAHVADADDVMRLRSATWLERRAWLSLFDHYLPRKFLNNYMDDTGTPIVLTLTEMQDVNPVVDLRRSTAFMAKVAGLVASGGGTAPLAVSGWGGARTNGTLGNFTIKYTGTVVVKADGSWTFSGTMKFHDYWDFDPKGGGSGRSLAGEAKTRVAAAFLPGKPFSIDSVSAPVSQSSKDPRAMWGTMAAPVFVGEKSGASKADIETGEVGGESGGAVGGPDAEGGGGEVGGETGEQAAQDRK